MLSFPVLHLLVCHQSCALDLLGGLQQSADPLLISSCFQHEKRPSALYKLNLEDKNSGMTKCRKRCLCIKKMTGYHIKTVCFLLEAKEQVIFRPSNLRKDLTCLLQNICLLLDLLYYKCNPLIKTGVDGSIFKKIFKT